MVFSSNPILPQLPRRFQQFFHAFAQRLPQRVERAVFACCRIHMRTANVIAAPKEKPHRRSEGKRVTRRSVHLLHFIGARSANQTFEMTRVNGRLNRKRKFRRD